MSEILTFLILAATTAAMSVNSSKPHVISETIEDLQFLSQLADELLSDQERTIVTSVSFEGDKAELESLAAKLYADKHVQSPIDDNNGKKCSLVLQNRVSGLKALPAAESWMKDTVANLEKLGIVGFWNISIEGWMIEGREMSALLDPVLLYISAYEVESDQNGQQLYTSYYSGLFHNSVMAEDEKFNLQILTNYSSEFKKWYMALGTPRITSY
ncbi:hypothetical protein [Paenibacillus sp. URB8-2]|uniref:hypothetical protein n=1 Tax=Paenibacillus sp. URB8-2 TaxID=2741301 RepID=UPI0015BAEFDE|nr:hypothetical protein [Paenibacillus sp. URB8-2]BCG60434.1 hypothetical protein PUR_38590 [Paenibacillus sp. URB8-2]